MFIQLLYSWYNCRVSEEQAVSCCYTEVYVFQKAVNNGIELVLLSYLFMD